MGDGPSESIQGRRIGVMDVVRYAKGAGAVEVELDGYLNFHYLTKAPARDDKQLLLESGINPTAPLVAADQRRRPTIQLRSSPWKAGHETNPWEDVYDLDHGHVRYYGDHKPSTNGPVGATPGNRALLEAWELHGSSRREDRALAPPLTLWRAVPVVNSLGRTVQKGHLEFCGVGVIERLELVIQREPGGHASFPNLVIDIVVLDLSDRDDTVDWRWIDDRRDRSLTADETLRQAPLSWRRWVTSGKVALPRVRRRVLSSRVRSPVDQRPVPGSREDEVLATIYRHFDGQKHRFEHLAATVAAQVFEGSGSRYNRGWLTRAGGDGGMDFVGRLDAGSLDANAPLVVLGQAKCVLPSSTISPDEVARVVARLRRGWIGIFVTTGSFSKQAQVEVIDDEYPIVLVPGGLLAKEVITLAEMAFEGNIQRALDAATAGYEQDVTHRRPEEILAQA